MRYFTFLFLLIALNLNAQQNIYQFDWKKDKYIMGGALSVLTTAFIIDRNQEIISIDDILALDPLSKSSFERSAISNYNLSSAKVSDYFRDGVFFVPFVALLSKNGKKEWKDIGLMYVETLLVNTSLTFINQSVVSKERPFIYNSDIPIEERAIKAARRSFYSGHVSHVASLSFFTASVMNDLYPDSNYKWLWWTAAASLPAATAYLRYDAGKHFPTDVFVGYAVGSLVGYLVPHLHKIKSDDLAFSLRPTGGGLSLALNVVLD